VLSLDHVPADGDPNDAAEAPPAPLLTMRQVGSCVLAAGEIDATTTDLFRAALAGPTVATIDLSAVTFMASAGLNELVRAVRDATSEGRQLRVVAVSPPVARLLDLTGLSALAPDPMPRASAAPTHTGPGQATRGPSPVDA
jgi:anti-sigma B factor antagonist